MLIVLANLAVIGNINCGALLYITATRRVFEGITSRLEHNHHSPSTPHEPRRVHLPQAKHHHAHISEQPTAHSKQRSNFSQPCVLAKVHPFHNNQHNSPISIPYHNPHSYIHPPPYGHQHLSSAYPGVVPFVVC